MWTFTLVLGTAPRGCVLLLSREMSLRSLIVNGATLLPLLTPFKRKHCLLDVVIIQGSIWHIWLTLFTLPLRHCPLLVLQRLQKNRTTPPPLTVLVKIVNALLGGLSRPSVGTPPMVVPLLLKGCTHKPPNPRVSRCILVVGRREKHKRLTSVPTLLPAKLRL